MLFELPAGFDNNTILGEFYPIYSSVMISAASLQGRPISGYGPLPELFTEAIVKTTSDEQKRIYEMRLQTHLSRLGNNAGGAPYNPVM